MHSYAGKPVGAFPSEMKAAMRIQCALAALLVALASPGYATDKCVHPPGEPPVCSMQPSEEPIPGLERIADCKLVERSHGLPGEGRLCSAVAYRVVATVTVYRKSVPGALSIDAWWALADPAGTPDQFRADYVMCAKWAAEAKTTCRLKPGIVVAVGYGQSLSCPEGIVRASAMPQLFLPGGPGEWAASVDCDDVDNGAKPSTTEPHLAQSGEDR